MANESEATLDEKSSPDSIDLLSAKIDNLNVKSTNGNQSEGQFSSNNKSNNTQTNNVSKAPPNSLNADSLNNNHDLNNNNNISLTNPSPSLSSSSSSSSPSSSSPPGSAISSSLSPTSTTGPSILTITTTVATATSNTSSTISTSVSSVSTPSTTTATSTNTQKNNNDDSTSGSNNNSVTKVSVSSSHYDAIKSVNNNLTSNSLKFGLPVPNRIFVGGIPPDVTDYELRQLFSQFGTVTSTKIILDRAGVSRGYGFITFEKEIHAQKAINDSNNLILNSRKLNVSPAVIKQGNQYSGTSIDSRLFANHVYNYSASYPELGYAGQMTQVQAQQASQSQPQSQQQATQHTVGGVNSTAVTTLPSSGHLYGTAGPYPGTFCSADGYLYQLPSSMTNAAAAAVAAVGAGANAAGTSGSLNGLSGTGQSTYLASLGHLASHGPGTISALTAQQAAAGYISSTSGPSAGQPGYAPAAGYPGHYAPHQAYVYTSNSIIGTNPQACTSVLSSGVNSAVPVSVSGGAIPTHLYSVQQQPQTGSAAQYSISQTPIIGTNPTSGTAYQYSTIPTIMNGGSTYYTAYGTGQQYAFDPTLHQQAPGAGIGTILSTGNVPTTALGSHQPGTTGNLHSNLAGQNPGLDAGAYAHPTVLNAHHTSQGYQALGYSGAPGQNSTAYGTNKAIIGNECELDSSAAISNPYDLIIYQQNGHPSLGHLSQPTAAHGAQQPTIGQQASQQQPQQQASHHSQHHHSQAAHFYNQQPAQAPHHPQTVPNQQPYYPMKYTKTGQIITPLPGNSVSVTSNNNKHPYHSGLATPATGTNVASSNGQYHHKDKSPSTSSSTSSRYNLSSGYSTSSNNSGQKSKHFNNGQLSVGNQVPGYNMKAGGKNSYHQPNSTQNHYHTNNNYNYSYSKDDLNNNNNSANNIKKNSSSINAGNLVTKTVNGVQLYAIDTSKNISSSINNDDIHATSNSNLNNNNNNNSDAIGKQSDSM